MCQCANDDATFIWFFSSYEVTYFSIIENETSMKTGIDLAEYHQVVGEMFPKQVTKEDWEKYKLTDDQIAFFNENGYLANVKVLDDEQVDQLNKYLAGIADPSHPQHHLFDGF